VVERIEDMPAGTVGFRASGKLTRDDYRDVMEPDLRSAADAGEIRMLFRLDSFDGLEPGAWFEDMKTGLGLGLGHHSAWKRSAIVTDVEWLAKAFQLFAWMTPGEVEVFAEDRLEDARRWVAG
jgi:stage II sporulation SpoAA-like protein